MKSARTTSNLKPGSADLATSPASSKRNVLFVLSFLLTYVILKDS
jgi:hypothetical protein